MNKPTDEDKGFMPLNLFKLQDVVDISDIEDLQQCKVVYISDSGVGITNKNYTYTTISGQSPARFSILKPKELDEKGIEIPEKRKREPGMYDDVLKNIKLPYKVEEFTVSQIAELNNLPYPYAAKWCRENTIECGKAEKKEGQRGKTATLYKLKS